MTRTDSVHLLAIHTTIRSRARSWLKHIVMRPSSTPMPPKTTSMSPHLSSSSVSDPSPLEAMTHPPCAVIVEMWRGSVTTRETFRRTTNGVRTHGNSNMPLGRRTHWRYVLMRWKTIRSGFAIVTFKFHTKSLNVKGVVLSRNLSIRDIGLCFPWNSTFNPLSVAS